jgi:hypothetical protein
MHPQSEGAGRFQQEAPGKEPAPKSRRPSLNRRRSALCLAAALASAFLANAGPARALIAPPVTIDGPSSAITDFGGVAMASDGTGGLVYVKSIDGIPHVFVSRFVGGQWNPPVRADWDLPFEASEPRIAASAGGELLVVWVAPVATVHGSVQYGLFSARLDAGATGFGPSLPIDGNVGKHPGVDPSVSSTSPGKAIVAYRAITNAFTPIDPPSASVQLRPGDVMAEIRVARLGGDRWSRLGAINANPEASTRPPTQVNGPKVGTGLDGSAVVAWQEPDQSGTARIWMRRIFGTTPGPILQASPSVWDGRPVSADADAFSLSVTRYTMAQVAIRIAKSAGSPLAGRLLVNSLPSNFSTSAATLSGVQLADGGPIVGGAGTPELATAEDGKGRASTRLVFLAGARLRQLGGEEGGDLTAIGTRAASQAQVGTTPVVAANPEGGSLVAYPALDTSGQPAVAVRQEYPSGAVQVGLLTGVQAGPVSELAVGRSGSGDGLLAFRQGEAGRYEIVAEQTSVSPASFRIVTPTRWVRPGGAKLHWEAPTSAVGGLTYAVFLNGRKIKGGLRRRVFHPRPAQLGSGSLRTQVLATDALGEQMLSKVARLRVDSEPPMALVRVRSGKANVALRDADSGVKAKATVVSFGDGTRVRHGSRLHHRYRGSGHYRIAVRARDRAGNWLRRTFEVSVP